MAVFLKHNDVEGYGQKEESGRTAPQDATLPAFRVLTLPSRLLKPHAVGVRYKDDTMLKKRRVRVNRCFCAEYSMEMTHSSNFTTFRMTPDGGLSMLYKPSTTDAMPCPTPMHIVATPYRAFRRFIS